MLLKIMKSFNFSTNINDTDWGCRLIPNFPPDMQERDNSREFVLF